MVLWTQRVKNTFLQGFHAFFSWDYINVNAFMSKALSSSTVTSKQPSKAQRLAKRSRMSFASIGLPSLVPPTSTKMGFRKDGPEVRSWMKRLASSKSFMGHFCCCRRGRASFTADSRLALVHTFLPPLHLPGWACRTWANCPTTSLPLHRMQTLRKRYPHACARASATLVLNVLIYIPFLDPFALAASPVCEAC